jgi:hypothetical protein
MALSSKDVLEPFILALTTDYEVDMQIFVSSLERAVKSGEAIKNKDLLQGLLNYLKKFDCYLDNFRKNFNFMIILFFIILLLSAQYN